MLLLVCMLAKPPTCTALWGHRLDLWLKELTSHPEVWELLENSNMQLWSHKLDLWLKELTSHPDV